MVEISPNFQAPKNNAIINHEFFLFVRKYIKKINDAILMMMMQHYCLIRILSRVGYVACLGEVFYQGSPDGLCKLRIVVRYSLQVIYIKSAVDLWFKLKTLLFGFRANLFYVFVANLRLIFFPVI